MSDVRLVNAPLFLEFEADEKQEVFKREYESLSELHEDPVGQWLKLAKARGETKESDQVLLTLIVELHKKIDTLSDLVQGVKKEYLQLQNSCNIISIGFEHLKIKEKLFEIDTLYYARVELPVFPKRVMPMFIRAIKEDLAKIELMHEKDTKDWSSYMVARERAMIRELKAKKSEQ
jgi:hypothetical protein